MKKFIYKTILISLPILIIPLCFLLFYGFPPPKLSISTSFNSTILNIKENQLINDYDILAIGSSMSLNNIHTKTVKKYFGNRYMNISSWGQNVSENYNLVKILTKQYKPKTILISSGYMDFNNIPKKINYNLVENYLLGNDMLIFKELNLKYLLIESREFFYMKNDSTGYSSLKYDDCGGVNFKSNDFKIDMKRWNGNNIKEFQIDELQYHYLDSLSQFCKKKEIDLVFIQSPFREGYYAQLDPASITILQVHEAKIDSILSKNNQKFINTRNITWDDNLFVDYSHFNENGAEKYTEYFINKIIEQ